MPPVKSEYLLVLKLQEGIEALNQHIFEKSITADLSLNKRIVTAVCSIGKNASCLTSFLELLRAEVGACGIK